MLSGVESDPSNPTLPKPPTSAPPSPRLLLPTKLPTKLPTAFKLPVLIAVVISLIVPPNPCTLPNSSAPVKSSTPLSSKFLTRPG